MRIVPVIDLKGGLVVHAVAGERHRYEPIRSQIAFDAQPATIARAFYERCGFREVYVADLDAISGSEPDWASYEPIAGAGLRLILDAGIATVGQAERIAAYARQTGFVEAVVVASESIRSEHDLAATWELLGPELAVFSLDLKHGRPLVACPAWSNRGPLEIAGKILAAGFRRLIVLDLLAVGTNHGPPTTELCRQLRGQFPALELISGGGVRDDADVQALYRAGCDRVLVATALHEGRISVQPENPVR